MAADTTTAYTTSHRIEYMDADGPECSLICYDPLHLAEIIITIVIGVLAIFGVLGNLINMYIFLKLKLNDSMDVELFALSMSDFAVSTVDLAKAVTFLSNDIFPNSPVDLIILANIHFGWAQYVGYLNSCWITAVISVERCLCVVAPFKVKLILTRRRSVAVLVFIFVVHISFLIPVYVAERLQWVETTPPCENCTTVPEFKLTIILSKFSEAAERALDIVVGMFLFFTSQTLLAICSVWMTYSLKLSSTVRSNPEIVNVYFASAKTNTSQLTSKEKKLIRMVLSLAVLQITCNVPILIFSIWFYAIANFTANGDDMHLNNVLWSIASLFYQGCCTCNTVCYYFMNSKHRAIFRETFCLT